MRQKILLIEVEKEIKKDILKSGELLERTTTMNAFWILVLVKRGCIEEPEIFSSLKEAQRRKSCLLHKRRKQHDIFGVCGVP